MFSFYMCEELCLMHYAVHCLGQQLQHLYVILHAIQLGLRLMIIFIIDYCHYYLN